MKRLLFIAITLIAQVLTCATQLYAQDDKTQKEYDAHVNYTYAERYYENGYFDQAISILDKLKNSQDATMRSSAYRLTALCHIEMGDIDQAKLDVQQLLAADPYFSPSASDNPILLKLINTNKRSGGATITTASQQAETIEESPVPVTLITEDMLKMIGARTLKDALIAFVPGMTDVASNEEMNVAMRGIYSSGQEKILILMNGHRLNSYSTNVATPDFSMSLEKIKQIEVLRGPASSIYGGVALTGVVNIITKEGLDIDGVKVKIATGNYGQIQGDILFGKRYLGLDVLFWANAYKSNGEKYFIEGTTEAQPYALLPVSGNVIIGGYNNKPTFDVGLNTKYNDIFLMYNWRSCKTVSAMSLSSGFTPYSYNRYMKLNNNSPGNYVESHHAELGYQKSKERFSLMVKFFCDYQSQQRYQACGDTIADLGEFITVYPYYTDTGVKLDHGAFQSVSWNEFTYGGKLQGTMNYSLPSSNNGTILLGGEYSNFSLNNSSYLEGMNYNTVVKTYFDEKLLFTGTEYMADAFLQVKHSFGKSLSMNGGIRYDYKKRRQGKVMHEWSPRIALVYNNPLLNVKLSYAKSFVDAPYFFRSNTLDVEYGDENLLPEILKSLQLSLYSNDRLMKGLTLDFNVFYNIATDVVTYDGNAAQNGGKLTSGGLELSARFARHRLSSEVNFTYQHVFSSDSYNAEGVRVRNIPEVQVNALASYKLLSWMSMYARANIVTEQSSLFTSLFGDQTPLSIPARCLMDFGMIFNWKNIEITADVHNLFNKKYTQGGGTVAPIIQQGAWMIAGISYRF